MGPEDLRHDLADQSVHVHLACHHWQAPEPGEGEQIVDERAHAPAVLADHGQVAPALTVEACGAVLLDHHREPIDRAQRRPQVVRHRVAEALQLLVDRSQLGGPFLGRLRSRRSSACASASRA